MRHGIENDEILFTSLMSCEHKTKERQNNIKNRVSYYASHN